MSSASRDLPPSGWVVVTCEPCQRRGCYRVDRILAALGPDLAELDLLRALTASCRHQHDPGSGKRRKYVPDCLATIRLPAWRNPDRVVKPTPQTIAYTVETWAADGSFELHLGTLYRLDMAVAAYDVACTIWPDTEITVRNRAQVIRQRDRPE